MPGQDCSLSQKKLDTKHDVLFTCLAIASTASEVSIMKRGCSSEDTPENASNREKGNSVQRGFPPILQRAGYVSNCKTQEQKVAAKQKIDPRLPCHVDSPSFVLTTMYDCVPVDSYGRIKSESVCTIRVASISFVSS